jgi:hypothetical protein
MRAPMRAAAATTCVVAAALAGCGNDRTPVPDASRPLAPGPAATVSFPHAGLRFAAPQAWRPTQGRAPLVASANGGTAAIAVWRYPRSERLPRTRAQLQAARDALVGAAKARDKTFALARTTVRRVDGRPAIELRGTETIAGAPRTVVSTHVYAFGGEIVIDAYAAARDFATTDAAVFGPLVRSLRLGEPRA